MEHSQKCIDRTEKAKARLTEYDAKWPDACRECDAAGMHTWYESRPWWGATASEPMAEPCECTAMILTLEDGRVLGQCPRCRAPQLVDEQAFVDGEVECGTCGWAWGRKPGDVRPGLWECDCWEAEIEEKIELARQIGLDA